MKVALCIRGGISVAGGPITNRTVTAASNSYVNYVACYNSIKKHIIDANPDCIFDIFIHCWNTDLERSLIDLYKPVAYCFEDNSAYREAILKYVIYPKDFGGISQALAIKKSIELMQSYERDQTTPYDIVILYRPDVLLWKDMILTSYPEIRTGAIYVNAHINKNGDFHFLMNSCVADRFKHLYDSLEHGNKHKQHQWIQAYVVHTMKSPLIMDSIIPGAHQEVLRKIRGCVGRSITIDKLLSYGVRETEYMAYRA